MGSELNRTGLQRMAQAEETIMKEMEENEHELEQMRSGKLGGAGGHDNCENLSKQ